MRLVLAKNQRQISPALKFALGLTLVASIASIWWPQPTANVALNPIEPGPLGASSAGKLTAGTNPLPGLRTADSGVPERLAFEEAEADPFFQTPPIAVTAEPVVEVAVPPTEPAVAMAEPVALLPPPVPTLAGRFITPDNQRLLFLQDGKATVQAQAGVQLPSGYRIESVGDDTIVVTHERHPKPVQINASTESQP